MTQLLTVTLPNPQKPEGVRHDRTIDLHHTFYTVQGEGPLVGSPSVFIRLAGCSLSCPVCDTLYTDGRRECQIGEVVAEVQALRNKHPGCWLAVLTGGEPLRQQVGPLINALMNEGLVVQVETNGLHYPPETPFGDPNLWVVCSPKVSKVDPTLERYVDAFKYVVQAGNVSRLDGLPITTLGNSQEVYRPSQVWYSSVGKNKRPRTNRDIFVSPLDEQDAAKNKANLDAALESCYKFGYRLSIQSHKIIGLE